MSGEAFAGALAGGVACAAPPVARGWALGMWAGSRLPLTSPPADQTWKSPPAYGPRKKVYSANIDFPQLPFLLGPHTVREMLVRSPLFTPALLGCPSRPWGAAEHGNHLISQLLPSLRSGSPPRCSTEPAHRFSSAIRTPDAPDGSWALPSYTHCDESCQPPALSRWPAGGCQPSPSVQEHIPSDRQREHRLCHHGLIAALDGTRSWRLTTGQGTTPCQTEPALPQPGQGIWTRNPALSSRRAQEDIMMKCIYCLRDENNPVFLLFQIAVWKSLCETDQICNYNTMENIAGMSRRVFSSWRFMTIAYFCWVYNCKKSNES